MLVFSPTQTKIDPEHCFTKLFMLLNRYYFIPLYTLLLSLWTVQKKNPKNEQNKALKQNQDKVWKGKR